VVVAVGGLLVLGAVVAVVVLSVMDIGAGAPAADGDSREPASADLGEPIGTVYRTRPTECVPMLECEIAVVPVDQDAPSEDDTMEVVFGVHRGDAATGTLVIATGGPGSSGVALAPQYLTLFPDGVLRRFDIVFFEQRGVGHSARQCHDTAEEIPVWRTMLELPDDEALAAATEWFEACLREADTESRAALDRYATHQAVADLDAYLDHIGAGKVTLFGESYGTEFAQTYAALRPDRVAGLVLDAVVDTDMDPFAAAVQSVESFSDVFDRVLDACREDSRCAGDFGSGGPEATWDRLVERLETGPESLGITNSAGERETVELSLDDLLWATTVTMYTEYERSMLLRALAHADRGDLGPMYRLAHAAFGLNPEQPQAKYWSSTSFHLIRCQGYPARMPDGVTRLRSEIDRMRGEGQRLAEILSGELPCMAGFAGAEDPNARPAVTGDFPVLLMTATADPPTPHAWARRVAERFANSYLFVTDDSSHGTFGWGFPCPDDAVITYLLRAELPSDRETKCLGGYLIEPYAPIPIGGPESYPDLLEAMSAVHDALRTSPDYIYWDGGRQTIGCPEGGTMSMTWDVEDTFVLHDCEVLPNWPMNGTALFGVDFSAEMDLTVPDGTLEYSFESGSMTLTGVIDGEEIDISR
jgi:pimeloyl-ACP methyl ester carboxylesterase